MYVTVAAAQQVGSWKKIKAEEHPSLEHFVLELLKK